MIPVQITVPKASLYKQKEVDRHTWVQPSAPGHPCRLKFTSSGPLLETVLFEDCLFMRAQERGWGGGRGVLFINNCVFHPFYLIHLFSVSLSRNLYSVFSAYQAPWTFHREQERCSCPCELYLLMDTSKPPNGL